MKTTRYNGVTAYIGMPGSGKTYSLAQVGLDALARGDRVVCNAGFDLAGAEVMETFEDFSSLEGPVVVVWDELPLYFNARKWAEFPDAMLYKFTQIRKDGIQLHYSAIHEMMIDTTIRRITFWYWHCAPVMSGLHRRQMYGPEEFRKANQRPLRTKWFRIKPEVAEAYDTHGKVALPRKLRESVVDGVPDRDGWREVAPGAERRGPSGVPRSPVGPVPEVPAAAIALPESWAG